MGDHGLPPLDPDAGLQRQVWNMGDHARAFISTAAEALDQHAAVAANGSAAGFAAVADAPDRMEVAADGRPVAVYLSPGARQQLAA